MQKIFIGDCETINDDCIRISEIRCETENIAFSIQELAVRRSDIFKLIDIETEHVMIQYRDGNNQGDFSYLILSCKDRRYTLEVKIASSDFYPTEYKIVITNIDFTPFLNLLNRVTRIG